MVVPLRLRQKLLASVTFIIISQGVDHANPADIGFNCGDQPDGFYAKQPCLPAYYSCVGGQTIKMTCPSNLIYDPRIRACVLVEHCGKPVATTADPPGINSYNGQQQQPRPQRPQAFPPQVQDFNCGGLSDGFRAKEPCQPVFYSCVGGVATQIMCPSGLVFNPAIRACDSEGQCGKPTTTTNESVSPTQREPTSIYGLQQQPSSEGNNSGPLDMSEQNLKRVKAYNQWLAYVADHIRRRKFDSALNVTGFRRYNLRSAEAEMRIFDGEDMVEAPFYAQLLNYNVGSLCGGAVIGRRFILTAAHCLMDLHRQDKQLFVIKIGSTEKEIGSALKVARYVLHEDFQEFASKTELAHHDIALILTEERISAKNFIKLASREERTGEEVRLIGFGETNMLDPSKLIFPRTLQEVSVKVSQSAPTTFTTSGRTGEGDSGSPLLWKEGGKYVLGGVQSAMVELRGGAEHPHIVRVFTFKKWIEFHMNKLLREEEL